MPTRYCLLTRRRPAHFRQPWTRSDDWKSFVEPPPCIAVHHNRCPGTSCWTAFGRHWSDPRPEPVRRRVGAWFPQPLESVIAQYVRLETREEHRGLRTHRAFQTCQCRVITYG